jgi:hypothetical protein
MKMNWEKFIGRIVNITMNENYGVMYGNRSPQEQPNFYEIVFKTGKLVGAYDEGLQLEAEKEGTNIQIFVFFSAIKCVEII